MVNSAMEIPNFIRKECDKNIQRHDDHVHECVKCQKLGLTLFVERNEF
jgi:hypothetical protein